SRSERSSLRGNHRHDSPHPNPLDGRRRRNPTFGVPRAVHEETPHLSELGRPVDNALDSSLPHRFVLSGYQCRALFTYSRDW
ncbi:hypothetical protein FRC00_000432, partial [Tulasnella sp. 408]